MDVRWSDAPAEFPPSTPPLDGSPRKMWLRTQDAYTGLPEFGLIADPKFLNIVLVLALTLLAIVRINRMETPLPRPFRRLRPPSKLDQCWEYPLATDIRQKAVMEGLY